MFDVSLFLISLFNVLGNALSGILDALKAFAGVAAIGIVVVCLTGCDLVTAQPFCPACELDDFTTEELLIEAGERGVEEALGWLWPDSQE